MPGIGGFIINGEKNLAQKNASLTAKMQWDAAYSSQSFLDRENNLALQAVSNSIVPFCKMELQERYRCVFYGELYPVSQNKAHGDYLSNVEAFLQNFLARGEELLLKTDGAFLLAVWDAREKSLTVANDIFGLYPLNYYHDKNSFIFSSQIFAVASLLPGIEQDETGLAELIALGMALNGRTWFRGIKRMLPATVLKFSRGKLQETTYYRPVYHPDESGARKEKTEAIGRLLEQAVEKRFSDTERTAVALSGGFDSRAVWSIYLGKRYPAVAITRGLKDSADMQIAEQISGRLGIPRRPYYLDNLSLTDFADWAEELIRMSEGFMNVRQALLVPYYRDLGSSFDVLVDSSGGALYRRQAFWRYGMPATNSKDLTRFTYLIQRKKLFTDGTIKRDYKEMYESKILQDIDEFYGGLKHCGQNGDFLDLYYLQQVCSLRTSADLLFQSHFINCRQPFYDRAAFEAVQKFSIKERKRLLIHRSLVQRNFPALKNFPLESGDYMIPYAGFRQKRLLPLILERVAGKARFLQFRKYPLLQTQGYFQHELNHFLKEVLQDSVSAVRPFLQKQKIEQLIKEHEQGRADYSAHFFHLLTVELFLRQLGTI